MNDSVIELHFAPSLLYFLLLKEGITIESCENYNKRSFRNKCLIKSNHGHQTLIVPLVKGKNKSSYQSVGISYEHRWYTSLNHTLQTEYGSSPYYMHYAEDILAILHHQYTNLFELNTELLRYLCKQLNIAFPPFSNEYLHEYPVGNDFRDQVNPKLIQQNPTVLNIHNYEYFQFIPGYTIMDVLFNYGPEAEYLIKQLSFEDYIRL